jgi:hypothetical protein
MRKRSPALLAILLSTAPVAAATDRSDGATWSGPVSRIFQERCRPATAPATSRRCRS